MRYKKRIYTSWHGTGNIVNGLILSINKLNWIIEKTKLYDKARGLLNERQEKLLARMFREGPEGFIGGLSVKNYLSITGASPATATGDLQDLAEKNIFTRTGELKSTRYHLNIAAK